MSSRVLFESTIQILAWNDCKNIKKYLSQDIRWSGRDSKRSHHREGITTFRRSVQVYECI